MKYSTTTDAESADYYCVVICPYCRGTHTPEECPRVEEIEYFQPMYGISRIKRVKLRGGNWNTEPAVTMTVTHHSNGMVYYSCPGCGRLSPISSKSCDCLGDEGG